MADIDKNIRITTNKNKPDPAKPQIVFTGSAAGSSVITLEVLNDNTLSFTSNEGQIFSLDSNLTVGTIWSVNDVSGVPMLRSSAGTTVGIAEYSGVVGIGETDPKHKLSVKGGFGIGSTTTASYTVFRFPAAGSGQTYILPSAYPGTGTSVLASDTAGNMSWVASSGGGGGSGTTSLNVNVTQGTTNAIHRIVFTPSTTTVAGAALSIDPMLSYNPTTDIFSTSGLAVTALTAAGSTSTGALTVAGGAGIAGSLWVGGPVSVGGTLDYATSNMIANFTGNANGYTQVIVHNHNSGASASTDLIVSNDSATDTTFYGDFGMNSSGWAATTQGLASANAVYLAAASGDLVLGTFTANALRVTIGSSSADTVYINNAGTAISINSNIDLRAAQSMRFLNSGNTFYTGIKAGANAANYTLTLPTAAVGVGYSTILVDTSGNMFFVPAEGGIAFTSATGNRPVLRQKQHHHIWFSSGYTPLAAGPDNVIFQIPDLFIDGTSDITYGLEAFYIRVETPSAGSSRVQVERSSTRTGAFTLAGTGSSLISGFGLTISGAGIYVTDTSVFGAGIYVTSGDLLRLNWTLLNATHANFSVQLTLAEI